jgi:hypothetical protein
MDGNQTVKKTLKELKPGDVIIWPLNTEKNTRHRSGAVVKVSLPVPPCVIADVLCQCDKFSAGIDAIYEVQEKK